MPKYDNRLLVEILKAVDMHDLYDQVLWRVYGSEVKFFIICNDLFYWGAADLEPIESYQDLKTLDQSMMDDKHSGQFLYCARRRNLRPQGACYGEMFDMDVWHYYDACGPVREVCFSNPKNKPEELPNA